MELFDILGRAVLSINSPFNQVFSDDFFEIMTGFDSVVIQRGNVQADHLENEITILSDGLYDIRVNVDAEFSSGDELEMMIFINDNQLSNNVPGLQGRGSGKPVFFSIQFLIDLSAGDVIDIRMKNGDSGNLDCLLRQVFLDIKADS